MGEVYRAHDGRLGRDVAIKILAREFGEDPERLHRFEKEAQSLAALHHPNVVAVFDVGSHGGTPFLVMELLEGETLRERLRAGPMALAEALDIAVQVGRGLEAAHAKGIVHRDLKPENVFLTGHGVKILDFGLAKQAAPIRSGEAGLQATEDLGQLTAAGSLLGTLGYMSPEQVRGEPVDARSDLFSLGVVLYEMLSGQNPFLAGTPADTLSAILKEQPRDLELPPRKTPPELTALLRACLEKRREDRVASARALLSALGSLESQPGPARPRRLGPAAWWSLIAAAAIVIALSGWFLRKARVERRALATLPAVSKLVDAREFAMAANLLKEARAILPGDPGVQALWLKMSQEVAIRTDPPGATVSIRAYQDGEDAWEELGRTPLPHARVAQSRWVWRVAKDGFETRLFLGPYPPKALLKMDAKGTLPEGMVRVTITDGSDDLYMPGLGHMPEVPMPDYLIDRTEVTNAAYKRFVDAGGYLNRAYWKQPFLRDGHLVPWPEAMQAFRDATGRPGPAGWGVGAYPKGQDLHPVTGVSWYEAAAYAEFAGKSLPTVHHWNSASSLGSAALIVPGSNFAGAGTRPVAGPGTLGGFGTVDMAGNAKEWCWNESAQGKRFILGGGYDEPSYTFSDYDIQSPWSRRPTFGFRCMKLLAPPEPGTLAPLEPAFRDFTKERPVAEQVFQAFRRAYAYDARDLRVQVEETETTPDWVRQKVTLDAAYGGERIILQVYLPTNAKPPYQTVVIYPGSQVMFESRLDTSTIEGDDFIVKSGHAFIYPIYKSTFERRDGLQTAFPDATVAYRDHLVKWVQDLGRTLDYLDSRQDLDRNLRAYYGVSWGGALAPILLAIHDRFRAAITVSGGFPYERPLPEADVANYAPRARVPILMLNGRLDAVFPQATSQAPMFHAFGTPAKDKKYVLYDSGHGLPPAEKIRETLAWLDHYLGPLHP